jgi:hypothetical protein
MGSYQINLPAIDVVAEGRFTFRHATKQVDGNLVQVVGNGSVYAPIYFGKSNFFIAPEVGIARSHVWAYERHSDWRKATNYLPFGGRVGFKKDYQIGYYKYVVLSDDGYNKPNGFATWVRATPSIGKGSKWHYFFEGNYSRTSFFSPGHNRTFVGSAFQFSWGLQKHLGK